MVVLITDIPRVKELNGNYNPSSAPTQFDQVIGRIIESATVLAAKRMKRELDSTTRRTRIYELRPGRKLITLHAYPIQSVSYVKHAYKRADLATADALATTEYTINNVTGQITLESIRGPGFLEVNYLGGMAATTEEFVSVYQDIAFNGTLEVVNRLNRAKNPEGNLATPMGNALTFSTEVATLKCFEEVLDQHVRHVYV